METISVHGAPSQYILEEGILDELEARLLERGFQKVLIVHGEKSWQAAQPFWPTFTELQYKELHLSVKILSLKLTFLSLLDSILRCRCWCWRWKSLDLTSSVSHVTHRPSVLIPTLPSNCSPWTPVSVVYDDSGAFIALMFIQ